MPEIDKTAAYSAFGADVFSDAEMERRLSPAVYRALHRTMEEGSELTFEVAGAVAAAMMAWAVERGATHYTHWFQPMTGITAEKHDSFISAQPVVFGQGAHPGRGGRIVVPVGRAARHVRGARLYHVGLHEPGVSQAQWRRHILPVHSDGVLFVFRRGAG